MSTPPKYPFRSRREIHSGQPKVYSDAPNEESLSTPSDPTPTPVRGNAVPTSDRVPASDPTPTPVRGASRFRSVRATHGVTPWRRAGSTAERAESTSTPERGIRTATPTSSDPTRPAWPGPRRQRRGRPRRPPSLSMTVPQTTASMTSSTAGWRPFSSQAHRGAVGDYRHALAQDRQRTASCTAPQAPPCHPLLLVLLLVIGLVGGAGYVAYSQLVNGSTTASDDYPGPGTTEVLVTIADQSTGRDIGSALYDAGVVKSVGAFVRQYEKEPRCPRHQSGHLPLQA